MRDGMVLLGSRDLGKRVLRGGSGVDGSVVGVDGGGGGGGSVGVVVTLVGVGVRSSHSRSFGLVLSWLTLSNSAGLATSLDALVAVLVMRSKVLKQLKLRLGDLLTRRDDVCESVGKLLESALVEVVLVCLHVAQL